MNDVVETLRQAVVGLKSRRNNEVSVNIPPETVLRHIFEVAGEKGFDHKSMMRISRTCALWRKICRGSPSLWQCLNLIRASSQVANLFFKMNSTVPFSIKAADVAQRIQPVRWPGRTRDVSHVWIENLNFTRNLSLGLSIPNKRSFSVKLEPKLLEVLDLYCAQYTSYDCSADVDCRCIEDIFGECPSLRCLSLKEILLPSTSATYDNLQTLSITMPSIIPNSLDIFSILRRTPQLEVLSLSVSDGESIFGSIIRAKNKLITLSQLRHITLALPSPDILHILSNIATGPSLRLSLKATNSKEFEAHDLLPLDARCIPSLSHAGKLCIDLENRKIKMYQSPQADGAVLDGDSLLAYTTNSAITFTLRSLTHLMLNVQRVKEFEFLDTTNHTEKLLAGDLVTILRLVPDIQRLRLRLCQGDICELFAIHAQHSTPRLCHALESLYIEEMSLEAEDMISLCSSLTPHAKSILVSRCSFDSPEESFMSTLHTIQTVDLQVIDCQFKLDIPDPITEPVIPDVSATVVDVNGVPGLSSEPNHVGELAPNRLDETQAAEHRVSVQPGVGMIKKKKIGRR